MNELQEKLFELQDLTYKEFHSALMPGIEKENVIGIRVPVLRRFAKEFAKTKEAEAFLQELPHRYYIYGPLRDRYTHATVSGRRF